VFIYCSYVQSPFTLDFAVGTSGFTPLLTVHHQHLFPRQILSTMAARPTPWPEFHFTTLPNILRLLASQYPDMTYAEFPRNPNDISEGYCEFTYLDVANAVNTLAWWIDENVGRLEEGKKNRKETLVYIGPNDIRYAVLCLASIVTGYKVSRVLLLKISR
jgi:hypothetical protein